jgi:branched-chain amino acid transport system permease protein
VRSPFGRVMIAMRENEDRSRMLGYNPFAVKLTALVLSGVYAGVAGAAYGILFGYAGASFATIQYSILPMLWVLMGGAGTTLGPLIGTALMFYLVDVAGSLTTATLLVVGVALLALILFAPRGILGTLREKGLTWLP